MVLEVMLMRSATAIGNAPEGTALFLNKPSFSPSMPMAKPVPFGISTPMGRVFQPSCRAKGAWKIVVPSASRMYRSMVKAVSASKSTLVRMVGSETENSMSQLSL